MNALAILLAWVGYGLLYAAAPGRQATPPRAPRLLRIGGGVLLVGAFALGVAAWEATVGALVVLTSVLAAASVFVIAGPLSGLFATRNGRKP